MYDNIQRNDNIINRKVFITNTFIMGAYIEVKSLIDEEFRVEFINGNNELEYTVNLRSNCWAKTSKKYFENYTCKVYDSENNLIHQEKYNANYRRVYIALDSKSLGDTLAWFPYVDEFRKKWNCSVVCSTFWNFLFEDSYPDIEFVSPGTIVNNLYAMYTIGWYYDGDSYDQERNPHDFKKISLQQTASDILGLDSTHVKAKIKMHSVEKKKKVGIAIHSTAQAKYWNNPNGWQEVTDYLLGNGYEVVVLSKEEDGYMGNNSPIGSKKFPSGTIEKLIEELSSCEFFIGIGSGLSWLAWTLNVPIILISGFSTPISEFSGDNVHRVFNENVCNGCFNKVRLEPGDWNWCPQHKGTERQFECTKSITFDMVRIEIDRILKKIRFNTP